MLLMILTAGALALLVMFGLWVVHLKIKNAGIVDVGWAGNFALIAVVFLLTSLDRAVRPLYFQSSAAKFLRNQQMS